MNIQKIECQIENFRKENEVPGISISLVKNNEIVYQNGFGYRDVLNKLPVTPKTIWPIASLQNLLHRSLRSNLLNKTNLICSNL